MKIAKFLAEKRNILFVINKKSGKKETNPEKLLHSYFHHNDDLNYYIYYPQFDNAKKEIREQVNHYDIDTVVAVGGDGTVKLVVESIIDEDVCIGILPSGSANGLARNLNIPESPLKALETITDNHYESITALKINNHNCIHLADIGYNAKLIKEFENIGKRGFVNYFRAAVKTLFSYKTFHAVINSDQEKVEVNAAMIVLANATKYGTGLVINPKGNMTDNKFEIIIIKKISFVEILKMISSNWKPHPKRTKIIQCQSATIETDEPIHFQIDGEYINKTKKINLHLLDKKVKVLCKRC